MSRIFSNNKKKRSRSSSSDNISFVRSVTSRISGMLPATLTRWFGSNSDLAGSNGSALTADATDSSSEDETTERVAGHVAAHVPAHVATHPPPFKRMRFTPVKGNHYSADDNQSNRVPDIADTLEPCRPALRRDPVPPPQPPPLPPPPTPRSLPTPPTPRSPPTPRLPPEDSSKGLVHRALPASSGGTPVARKRKSLFDGITSVEAETAVAETNNNDTVRDPREPCFKPILLGSPFYPGRTTYGGALTSYINHSNIKQSKNAIVNETSTENNAISHSARRVMDLLEHYSSPLREARRLPQYERNTSLHNIYDGSPYGKKSISYKTQELHVPTIASIMQLKQRSRLMDTTTAARQLIASHSSTLGFRPHYVTPMRAHSREETTNEPSNLTTKVKARVSRPTRGEAGALETSVPAPLELPSAVLHIDRDQLPKFSFGIPPGSQPTTSTPRLFSRIDSNTSTDMTITPISKPENSNTSPYKFSCPVTISSHSTEKYTVPKFTFGSPERGLDRTHVNQNDSNPACVVGKPKESIQAIKMKTDDWQCPKCWVANKIDVGKCVCCECIRPSKDTEKPKCPICKRGDSQPHCSCAPKVTKPTSTKTVDSTKWKCEDCWINNDVGVDRCVCCGGRRAVAAAAPIVNTNDSSEWKCNDCWIKNKTTVEVCAACGAAKPGGKADKSTPLYKSLVVPTNKPPDDKLQNANNSQTDKWECATCLVSSDTNRTKCVCCETERSVAAREPEKKQFNFGVNTTFKFGIDLKLQEATAKSSDTTDAKTKAREASDNNNVLSTSPTFSFGVPKAAVTETEKPQEVPKICFSDAKTPVNMNSGSFLLPPTVDTSKESMPPPRFAFTEAQNKSELNLRTTPEKMPSANVLPLPTVVTTTESLPPPRLTFTEAQNKSELNSRITPEKIPTANVLALPTVVTTTESLPPPRFTFNEAQNKSELNSRITPEKMPSANVLALPTVVTTTESLPPPRFSFTETQNSSELNTGITSEKNTSANVLALPTVMTTTESLPSPRFTFSVTQNKSDLKSTITSEKSDNALLMPAVVTCAEAQPPPRFTFRMTPNKSDLQSIAPDKNDSGNVLQLPAMATSTEATFPFTTASKSAALFAAPATTATMFNSDPAKVSSTLFQKNELTAVAAPLPLGAAAPMFSFGTNTNAQPPAQPEPDKPKFNFSFGNNTSESSGMFKPPFGTTDNNTSKFTMGIGNAIGAATATLSGGTGLPTNALASSESNPLSSVSGLQPNNTLSAPSSIFGAAIPKKSLWSSSNNSNLFVTNAPSSNNNLFVTNAATNSLQKPPGFSFGSSTPFAAPAAQPAFGSNTQPAANIFGISNQNGSNQMFSSPVQSQGAVNMFGSSASGPAPPAGVFGPAGGQAAPAFGAPAGSLPQFEAPAHAPAAAAPAFNFGATQSSNIFGFGQQVPQQPQQQAGALYSFGAVPNASPQVQFNMGSAPNTAVRRVRKAVRRNTPR